MSHAPARPATALRDAAHRLRARADATTPSGQDPHGWCGVVGPDNSRLLRGGPTEGGYRMGTVFQFAESSQCDTCARPSAADLEHMATWHPDMAYAVADFLDLAACSADYVTDSMPPFAAIALRIAAMVPPAELWDITPLTAAEASSQ